MKWLIAVSLFLLFLLIILAIPAFIGNRKWIMKNLQEFGKNEDKKEPEKRERWSPKKQAAIITLLLIAMIIFLFLNPLKMVMENYPLVAVAIVIGTAMLLIGGNAEQTIKNLRKIALVTIIGLFVWFVVWPGIFEKPINTNLDNWTKNRQQTKLNQEKTVTRFNLVSTGITLQPGEKIVGTKEPDAPPIELVVRFPDGEEVKINQKHWTSRSIGLTHVGDNVKDRPGEIFYRGDEGKYRFKKVSVNTVATAYPPPIGEKAPCPFN